MKRQIRDLPSGSIIHVHNNFYKVTHSPTGFYGSMSELTPIEEGKGFRRFITQKDEVEVISLGKER